MTQGSPDGGSRSERDLAQERVGRRRFLKGLAVGSAGLAVSQLRAACEQPAAAQTSTKPAPGQAAPTSPLKATPVAELEGVVAPMAARGELPEQTIVLAMFSGPEADVHKRLAPRWQEYTKGRVKLAVEDLGRSPVSDQKMMTTMMAKSDAWDVVWDRSLRMPTSAPAGFFAPLKTFMADPNLYNAKAYDMQDFPKGVRDLFSYKGEQYGLPQEVSVILMTYRKDLFAKYGIKEPPETGWTWEELREAALRLKDKLKADNQPRDVFPLVFGAKKGGMAGIQTVHTFWGRGLEWFDDKNQAPKFNQPAGVEALRFMTDLLWRDQVVSPGIVDYEYMEILTAYQQGKAVIALQWEAAAPTFNNKEKSPITAGNIGYTLYPTFKKRDPTFPPGWAHGHGICVSAYSKKQKAAFEYLVWFTSKEIAKDYVPRGGGMSGRMSVINDREVKGSGPHMQAYANHSRRGLHPWPDTPENQWIVYTGLDTQMNAMWTKQKSVEDALKGADSDVTAFYREKGLK